MRSAVVSLVFAVVALAQDSGFMINTPANAVVCQPLQITWTGGTPPYFLSILPGGQPSAPALVDLGTQNGNSVTWTVNQQVGTSLGLTLRDSTGAVVQSAPFNVNPGSDTSCVGQNPSASAGGSTTAGGSTPAGSTTPGTAPATSSTAPATSPAATSAPATSAAATTAPRPTTTAATSTRAGASSGTSAASTATTSSPNAGSTNLAQAGAAGILGAALAAILI